MANDKKQEASIAQKGNNNSKAKFKEIVSNLNYTEKIEYLSKLKDLKFTYLGATHRNQDSATSNASISTARMKAQQLGVMYRDHTFLRYQIAYLSQNIANSVQGDIPIAKSKLSKIKKLWRSIWH